MRRRAFADAQAGVGRGALREQAVDVALPLAVGPAAPSAPGAAHPGLQLQSNVLLDELATATLNTAAVQATLLHSRGAARSAGMWRHAAGNGFDPARFARLQVVPIDGDHL